MGGPWAAAAGRPHHRAGSASPDCCAAALSATTATYRAECSSTPSHQPSNSTSNPTGILRSMTRSRRRSIDRDSPAERMMTSREYEALPASIRYVRPRLPAAVCRVAWPQPSCAAICLLDVSTLMQAIFTQDHETRCLIDDLYLCCLHSRREGLMWQLAIAASRSRPPACETEANHHHRKKYFSSQERERITHQSKPSIDKRSKRKATPEPCHISTLPDNWKPNSDRKQNKSMTSSFLRSRRRHSRPNIEQATVSEEQAAWFLSLPDKVKRQHFSKEEQILLTYRCETTLDKNGVTVQQESAQDYCRRQLTRQSEDGQKRKHRRRSSAPATIASACVDDQTLSDLANAEAQQAVEDGEEGDKMAILNLYSRRHSVATTRENVPEPPVIPPAQIRSFRRSFALRPLPIPAPVLAPCPSPGFFKDSQKSPKSRHRPTGSSTTPPGTSSGAKHYKDPEMRQALRAITSPKFFDEALEYGFPAPPNNKLMPLGLQDKARSRPHSRSNAFTHENDRSSSLTSSSTANSLGRPGPSTPEGPADFPGRGSGAYDKAPDSSHKPPSPQSHNLHRRAMTTDHQRTPSAANREMTLRVTLTRPIAQATEEELSAAPKTPLLPPMIDQYDPLALESITVCDDPTGAQGAFAIPENSQNFRGIKKAFKQLVRK